MTSRNYSINNSDGITAICFLKPPSPDDIFNAVDDVAAGFPSNLRLWDLSQSRLNLTGDQLHVIADYAKSKLIEPSKLVVVAPNDLTFGLSRLFSVYRSTSQSETRVYRTEKEALEWLHHQS